MFSVRLVLADHYMSPPIPELDVGYSEFRGTEVKQVPVIRIFGSTTTGKKACLHIHGVFPYMYIPCEASGEYERMMYQIASGLDKALNISFGKANSTAQHVFRVTLISGMPFYGFHTKEHLYFKIYFYNPLMVKKAAELLQSGAILNRMYQPHETHVPYILQFMIDYNLYGMSHVNLRNVKFRRDPQHPGSSECLSEEMLLPERVTRISTCETEVDAVAADIMNRTAVSGELALNPGLAAIWEDEKQRRREERRTSQITPQPSQERPFVTSTDSALFFKQKLHEKLLLLNTQLSNDSSSLLDVPEVARSPYPVEAPEDSEFLRASFVDSNVESSGPSSLIRSGQMEQDNNASVVDEDLVLTLLSSRKEGTHNSVLMDSQDVELAEVLYNLENIGDVDDDSVLGSQICRELQDETVEGCDDEDMQGLSESLDVVVDCNVDDDYEQGNVNSSTDHDGDSLWENTFWNDVNESISQLDGTDDVLDVPRRKRMGVRGKSFLQKPVPKPSAENCITAVSVLASNSEMFCNDVAELKTNEFCLSTGPVAVDARNAVNARGIETHHEDDSVRNCLLSSSEDAEGSVSQENMEGSLQTGPVATDDSAIDTKGDDCIGTIDMKTDPEMRPIEPSSLLVVARNVNDPVDAGIKTSLLEDHPSSVTRVSHENGIETEPTVDLNSLAAIPEDCVEPALTEVRKLESLQMLSEPLVEVSESVTAVMLLDTSSNVIIDALPRVSHDNGVQVMGCVGSDPADVKDKQTNNGHAVNSKICIAGKRSANEKGTNLVADGAAVSIQSGNILSEFLQSSSNTPTLTASQVRAITINEDKLTGLSNGRYLKKLARELRRRKSKKLSLSHRRKAASITSEESNTHIMDSGVCGAVSVCDSTGTGSISVASPHSGNKQKISDRSNMAERSVQKLNSLLQKAVSKVKIQEHTNLSGHSAPSAEPCCYKLRSFHVQRQKNLTSHHAVARPTGLVESHFGKDGTCSLLRNFLNNSSGYEHAAHLSRHAESVTKGHVSPACGMVEGNKKGGQVKQSYLTVKYLDDGNMPNHSVAGIESTVEPVTKFESTGSAQFISNVGIHCKEKVQSGSSCHRRFQNVALKERAFYNTSPYPNTACIRPCHVKLVRLEDTDKQVWTSPRKMKNCKVSAVHLRCIRNDLLKCTCSKMSGKVCQVAGCHCKCVADGEAKRRPHIASIAVQSVEEMGVAVRPGTKQISVSVPALGSLWRFRGSESKINIAKNSGNRLAHMNMTKQFSGNVICGDIDGFMGHVPVEAEYGNQLNSVTSLGRHIAASEAGEKTDSEITENSLLKTEFVEVANKAFHIQEKCDTNSVQIGHRKHLRRKISKGKKPTSTKLRKYKLPDQLNLLNEMKAVSVSLERLSQSVLEKYSAASASVRYRSVPRKGTESTQQETAENGGSYSGACCKHITSPGNVKCVHCWDRIPCLDGVIETSSSDDSSDSRSADRLKQLEKSPVIEKTRSQENTIQTFEDKLVDLRHQDTSVVTQKPRSGTPSGNTKWVNTASSTSVCSPSRSPRRTLYPPLAIRIQKSPKKRTLNTEGKFQQRSELIKHIPFPSNRLSGEETEPNHVSAERNLASVHSEDTCVRAGLHPTAVTPHSVCHDARTPEDQLSISVEKRISPPCATKQRNVYIEDTCQIGMSHEMNVSSCKSCKTLEYDRMSDKSEVRNDGASISEVHVCSQTGPSGTVSKTGKRGQPMSPFSGSHLENELCLGAQESDCESVVQGSGRVCADGGRTSRNSSCSVAVEFQERKRIAKRRQSVDMFSAEEATHSGASLPGMKTTRERKWHKTAAITNSTGKSETNLYERSSSVGSVSNKNMEEVDDRCTFSDSEAPEEGVLSYYSETTLCSPTVSSQFQKFVGTPSVCADDVSRLEQGLECALFMCTKQSCSGGVAETHIDGINQASLTERLHVKGSRFRTAAADHKNCKVYTPRINPPSKHKILASLSEFDIPEYRYQEPFFGNVLDTGNKKEVGNKVLKVTSVCDLQPFAGSLRDILDIETWRQKWLQEFSRDYEGSSDQNSDLGLCNMKPALASHRDVVITPCKLPPSVTDVKLWFEATQKSTVQKVERNNLDDEVNIRKIIMPLSPGQESVSDDMSLSPATPREQNERGEVTTSHSTPQVTLASHHLPSPSFTPIRTSRQMLLKHSRKGLKLDSPNQENVSCTLPPIREEPEAATVETGWERGAAKRKPIRNESSEPLHVRDTSAAYKQQDSEDLRSIEQIQPESAVGLIPSSQVPGKEQTAHKIQLCQQDHPVLTARRDAKGANSSCQIEESTPNNTYGFQMSFQNLHEAKAICEHQFLTMFVMELHISTRGDLKPDPAYDPIRALFYMVVNDVPEDAGLSKQELAVIVVNNLDTSVKNPLFKNAGENCKVTCVEDETSLVLELVKRVKNWDPDILGGYEVEMLSWGYLFQRAYTLQMNVGSLISRLPNSSPGNQHTGNKSSACDLIEEVRLTGRIMLNIWRLMRHEVALQSYTFQNVMYHILHQRIPLHSFKHLTFWWEHRSHLYRWICVEYYLLRVQGIIKLLDQLDLIGRTSELARLFGIQFLEVLSRGSQFRVESMMLRLAKPLNYVPVSPSVQQRARMRAPESFPLIMEPVSRFYSDPVIVLDFQSLYPSIIIAHNYCFSTCLGRVESLGQASPFAFGCTQLKIPPAHLVKLENNINISPCGVAFVEGGIRRGVLPRMLQEILDTRLMVKQSMKRDKSNKTLQRVLHSRQLGLKLIANVTYGYTAANFSGRMPCIELGDSVVSKARETLERAIRLVEATARWGARVVYGDTDSLFVLVPGKSRQQAFKIGAEIAEAVTLDNPKPVKLKLEKVYQPCILQTKKRYVGYMYETPDQEKPVYDAKGIETVRRDGCPAVAKILEKSLRLVFETKDVSLVKSYVCRQFIKLLQGRLNIQDLIFAREYRGMSGYRPGACVPALELTRRWLQTDRRAEPRISERVPYVIVNGPPGLPLIRLVRSPLDLLADPSLRPNAAYYITRIVIPPLDRCFSLLGAEVESWYAEMPRKCVASLPTALPSGLKKSTISQYFVTMNCAVCDKLTNSGICLSCQQQPQRVAVVLANKVRLWERTHTNITKVCQSCCAHPTATDCDSLDCPILFRRSQAARDLQQAHFIRNLQDQYLAF